MKYAVYFLAIAAALLVLGAMSHDAVSRIAQWYLSGSLAATGGLYLFRSDLAALKNARGQLTMISWIVFLPYLVLARISFRLKTFFMPDAALHQITDRVYLGRYLRRREFAVFDRIGIQAILDLTWEFSESQRLLAGRKYFSLPVLDGTAPSSEQLKIGSDWLAEQTAQGPVAVHCALGHGRSATLVVAYLLLSGRASTVDEAIDLVTRHRPRVGLNREQLAAVAKYEKPRP